MRKFNQTAVHRWSAGAALGLLYAAVVWWTAAWVQDTTLESIEDAGRHQLNLYVANLQGQLEKYEYLPELISTNKRLLDLLLNPPDEQRVTALNRYLEEIGLISDAADVYVMDAQGSTNAASNWLSERPFVGRNFSYRPYFQEAMQGRLGRYFALGITSLKRGYYYAYPVRYENAILGAVVIKVDLSDVEKQWLGLPQEVIVTDPDGVIFISTRPEWRFLSLLPLAESGRKRILKSRRYLDARLEALPAVFSARGDGDTQILELQASSEADEEAGRTSYLMQAQPMPEAGWSVHLLTPLGVVLQRVLEALAIVTAVFFALLFLGLGMRQRRKRGIERARSDQRARQALRRAHDELEQRVRARTADLRASNEHLSREIEERRRAEEELRHAQTELIQAAKLATLGQMAAGISHELNQPLAAIRSYADNGRALLQKERPKEVRWNLEQISDLTDRMARIGSQLKIFSRKSTGQIGRVAVRAVIEAARAIVAPRAKRSNAEVKVDLPAEDLWVRGDEVLLQQVLVNLLGNALQAVDRQPQRLVRFHATAVGDQVSLVVEDTGPGIADEFLDRIFDPFFTTKEASEGLGLGLTISSRIIEELNGRLSAGSGQLGGARFEILLPSADQNSNATATRRSFAHQGGRYNS